MSDRYICTMCGGRVDNDEYDQRCVDCGFAGPHGYDIWGDGPTEVCPQCGSDRVPEDVCPICFGAMTVLCPDEEEPK